MADLPKTKAYILCRFGSDADEKVPVFLRDRPEVTSTWMVFGEWDMVIEAELTSEANLAEFILDLRKHANVNLTTTLIGAKPIK